jgi:hypothetical protein
MHVRISAIYGTGAVPAEDGGLERHVLLLRHRETDLIDSDATRVRASDDETRQGDSPSDCAP